jgi:hypothetical protein
LIQDQDKTVAEENQQKFKQSVYTLLSEKALYTSQEFLQPLQFDIYTGSQAFIFSQAINDITGAEVSLRGQPITSAFHCVIEVMIPPEQTTAAILA